MIMDCDYFKAHIQEELEGAKEYAKTALSVKATSQSDAKIFSDMATQELSHAKNFYDMFLAYYEKTVKPYSEPPKVFRDMKDEILDMYMECYAKAKCMIEMLNK